MGIPFLKEFRISRKQLTSILFGPVLVLVIVGGLTLVLVQRQASSTNSSQKSDHSSSHEDCSMKCDKTEFDRTPLVVISLDGFRRDYVDRNIVKTFELMTKCGTAAEYMYASFPSKTFPNHYSIATGLYPESTGITDNIVYDERFTSIPTDVRRAKDKRYFNGVPIWNFLGQQNITTACLYWAGCDYPINGMQPTYNLKRNSSLSYRDRIDQILSWLEMPADKRPALIMAYFHQPDSVGHYHKSRAEVNKKLEEINSLLKYLFKTLHTRGLLNCVNIIILSDHGMQKLDHRYYMNELVNSTDALYSHGVIGRIHFPNTSSIALQTQITETMKSFGCANSNHFRVYDRRRLPKRYHHSATRSVGDIILEGQSGTYFARSRGASNSRRYDHGYDFILPSMRTIFYARGPNIARHLVLKPFQNVELYNLFAGLLKVNSDVPPNNGTAGRLDKVMKGLSVKKHRRAEPLKDCRSSGSGTEDEKLCASDASSLISGNEQLCYLPSCINGYLRSALISSSYSNRTVALIERIIPETDDPKKQGKERKSSKLTTSNLSVQDANNLTAALYVDFMEGHFADLQKLTSRYVKQLGEIVVVSGPIHDFDDDGLADPVTSSQLQYQSDTMPSHIFRAIFRCDNSQWLKNKFECKDPKSLRALAFILPNVPDDYNCLNSYAYLTANTARLRDIELLTGLEFFPASLTPEEELYDDDFAVTLRTLMPEKLWPNLLRSVVLALLDWKTAECEFRNPSRKSFLPYIL